LQGCPAEKLSLYELMKFRGNLHEQPRKISISRIKPLFPAGIRVYYPADTLAGMPEPGIPVSLIVQLQFSVKLSYLSVVEWFLTCWIHQVPIIH
jgi:hypothetical protein